MRVALAHDHLNQIGGAEQVLAVLHNLYPDSPVYTLLYDKEQVGAFTYDWDIRTSFLKNLPGGLRWFKWYVWLMPTAVEQFDFSQYDLVVSSSSALMKGIVVKTDTVHVCYCHTPTRYLWSDTHQYTSELPQPKFIKALLPIVLTRLRQWDYLAAQRVDYFVANSQFIAKRIQKYYRREAEVIYPPVPVHKYSQLAEPEDYYLIVSRLRPYKRVDLAIRAFNKLGMPLRIIGSGEQEAELKSLAGPNISFLGNVSDEVKVQQLARCRALIFPQEEDFGITAVEALASGRPVIAYDAGGVREIVTNGVTGKLFPEQSWQALADAVIRFRYEQYDPLKAQASVAKFSVTTFEQVWQKMISKVTEHTQV